jgi:hypothetical protein
MSRSVPVVLSLLAALAFISMAAAAPTSGPTSQSHASDTEVLQLAQALVDPSAEYVDRMRALERIQ